MGGKPRNMYNRKPRKKIPRLVALPSHYHYSSAHCHLEWSHLLGSKLWAKKICLQTTIQ